MFLPPSKYFLLKEETVRDNINKKTPCSISPLPQMTGSIAWQNLGQLSYPLCSEMMSWQVISWATIEMGNLLSLWVENLFCSWQQQSPREELDVCALRASGSVESVRCPGICVVWLLLPLPCWQRSLPTSLLSHSLYMQLPPMFYNDHLSVLVLFSSSFYQ